MKTVTAAIAILATIGVVMGGVLFAFGTPQAPASATAPAPAESFAPPSAMEAPSPGETPVGGDASIAQRTATDPASMEAPPADPSVPLAIEIPGCTCHSDDPKLVEQHAQYRMNQCAGCHAGEVPTGE